VGQIELRADRSTAEPQSRPRLCACVGTHFDTLQFDVRTVNPAPTRSTQTPAGAKLPSQEMMHRKLTDSMKEKQGPTRLRIIPLVVVVGGVRGSFTRHSQPSRYQRTQRSLATRWLPANATEGDSLATCCRRWQQWLVRSCRLGRGTRTWSWPILFAKSKTFYNPTPTSLWCAHEPCREATGRGSYRDPG
jgi:hypothetical protein